MPPEMAFYRKTEALAEPRPLKEYHVVCVCLRTSTPVVEDDQDIGESNASVTINIGGAGLIAAIIRNDFAGVNDAV